LNQPGVAHTRADLFKYGNFNDGAFIELDGIFATNQGSRAELYQITTEGVTLKTEFLQHSANVNSVQFTPDFQSVVSADESGVVFIWDWETGEIQQMFSHQAGANSAIINSDGSLLAVGLSDGSVSIWNLFTGENITTLSSSHDLSVEDLAFSPGGDLMVSVGITSNFEGVGAVWDVAAWTQLGEINHRSGAIYAVAFSPDGNYIATASDDYTIGIWDPHSTKRVLTFTGHSGSVRDVEFDRESTRVISGSFDGTMKVWDIETGLELFSYSEFLTEVNVVGFDASGDYMVGIDRTGRLRQVVIGFGKLLELAQIYVVEDLIPQDCLKFLGEAECSLEIVTPDEFYLE
jgi:WD40 repeat protein